MINFDRSIRTIYSSDLSSAKLTNEEKLLLVVAVLTRGIVGDRISTASIINNWSKVLFKIVYHHRYATAAEDAGWIDRGSRGYMSLTEDGFEHLESLSEDNSLDPLADATELLVFSAKQAHDFDRMLRGVLASATNHVRIADSYVDETIFDTLLNEIPHAVRVELMFNHGAGSVFDQRATRFKVQYSNFHHARYPKLHDRYLIVDNVGFVIGPSLKDAAVNAPALLVRIGSDQSTKLITLFDNTFKHLRKIT